MSEQIVNRVAESALQTIDLEQLLPAEVPVLFDLKEYLFMSLIVKEKEFRASLQQIDLSVYNGKTVLIICSADAIIPMWAYMLVAAVLEPVAKDVFFGNEIDWKKQQLLQAITALDINRYNGQRVVVKGCGDEPIPEAAYMEITKRLRPVAKSIMYGEPCSTVPIYKQPK